MTHDLRDLQRNKHLRAFGAFLLGLVCAFQVNATITVENGVGYKVYTIPSNTMGGAPSSYTIFTDGSPQPLAKKPMPLTTTSGANAVVDVEAKIVKRGAAKVLTKALGIVPILGTGVAIWELCKELDFGCSKGADGQPVVTKSDPEICTSSPCYTYMAMSNTGLDVYEFQTLSAAQAFYVQWWNGGQSVGTVTWQQVPKAGGYYWNATSSIYGVRYQAIDTRPAAPSSPSPIPSSLQDLEDAIATESGWPSSSNYSPALKQALEATGDPLPVEPVPRVTGPATTVGPTKTTTNADGTKSVTNITHNHTYEGNKVTTTNITNTTNYNTANQPTGTTTTTEEPTPEKQSDCEKNPDSNACREDEFDTPAGDIPKSEKLITYQAENLGFGGGSCPADVMQTPHGMAAPIKLVDWANNCNMITTYVKPMILALATFGALMILFAGGRPE